MLNQPFSAKVLENLAENILAIMVFLGESVLTPERKKKYLKKCPDRPTDPTWKVHPPVKEDFFRGLLYQIKSPLHSMNKVIFLKPTITFLELTVVLYKKK